MDSDSSVSDPGESFRKKPSHSVLSGALKREKTEVEFEEQVVEPRRRMSIYEPATTVERERTFSPSDKIPDAPRYMAPTISSTLRTESLPPIRQEYLSTGALPPIAHPRPARIKEKHLKNLPRTSVSESTEEEGEETTRKKNATAMMLGIVFGIGGVFLFLVGMALLWLAHEDYFSYLKDDGAIVAGAVVLVIGVLAFTGGCVLYHVIHKRILNPPRRHPPPEKLIAAVAVPEKYPSVQGRSNILPPLKFGKRKRKKGGLKRRASQIPNTDGMELPELPSTSGIKYSGPGRSRVHPSEDELS